jgi:curved DNA-binding protein
VEYRDYYALLGVDRKADADTIKRAYRKRARTYHPDLNKDPDAEAQFKAIGEAWAVLGDPEQRAAYDALGAGWQDQQRFEPPPGWARQFHPADDGFRPDSAASVGDLFASLFGDRTGWTATRGRDAETIAANTRLRLRGRGLPRAHGTPGAEPRGDQLVTLRVVLPDASSPTARALYKRMATELAFDPRAPTHGAGAP